MEGEINEEICVGSHGNGSTDQRNIYGLFFFGGRNGNGG
jgi:hypothetical protein